ncbi:MAG: WD40 repeat domain-containing protein [Pirellulales bacterium]
MPRTRCITLVCIVNMLAWLGSATSLPMCFGSDKPPGDLVLLRSFSNPLPVTQVAVSKSGHSIACDIQLSKRTRFTDASLADAGIYLWDIRTGVCSRAKPALPITYGDRAYTHSFATVPYARLCFWPVSGLEVQDDLATPTKVPIRLDSLERAVDVEGWLHFPIAGEGSARMGRVFFSANDEYLAAVRYDRSVHVWNRRTGKHLGRFLLPKTVSEDAVEVGSFVFDSTNRYLAAGLDTYMRPGMYGGVIVWDLKTGKEVLSTAEEYRVFQVAFSADGELICGEGGVHPNAIDSPGRITVRERVREGGFGPARSIYAPRAVRSVAILPHGRLVSGDTQGQVLVWQVEGKLMAVAKESGEEVVAVAVGQDGGLIASGDSDCVVRVWKTGGASSEMEEERRGDIHQK